MPINFRFQPLCRDVHKGCYAQIAVMNSFGPAVSFSPLASGICELFSFT